MPDQNDARYVSLKWLIGMLVALFAFASTQLVYDLKKNIEKAIYATECLTKEKVDKADYNRDMLDMKSSLNRIEDKIDKMKAGR